MPEQNFRNRGKWIDRLVESAVYLSGALVLVAIGAIFYYLAHDSKYAFKQKFTYGFIFAAQPEDMDKTLPEFSDISYDVNASIVTVHNEGDEGLDAKEERTTMPTIESLNGVWPVGTGTVLGGDISKIAPDLLNKDDWRKPKDAEEAHRFALFVFATPEYKKERLKLKWDVSEGTDPAIVPFDLRLKLTQKPAGVQIGEINIDLKNQKKGEIDLPTFVAKTDDDRTKGYVFELTATPITSTWWATITNFFRTEWGPTLAHPRYGFLPLLAGTLFMTILALLIAAPIGIASAIYVSEFASSKVREFLKPVVEMLASVPTIVLGYFGLMLVAPWIQSAIAKPLGIDSSRSLLAAAIMLAVLLVPVIMTLSEDALRGIPRSLRDGGEALGLTATETLRKVTLPAAKAGLIGAIMLGFARAIGETMIIWVLSGGTPNMPAFSSPRGFAENLVKPTRGIPDTIGIEMGNVTFEETHYGHLFLLGLVLFLLTLTINLISHKYIRRHAWRH